MLAGNIRAEMIRGSRRDMMLLKCVGAARLHRCRFHFDDGLVRAIYFTTQRMSTPMAMPLRHFTAWLDGLKAP